ncbi:MCE family protein [Rhodococcus coprophilus]|uniref:Mce family protein n=1 Tax=Rhodococcus coprophilus TaxID=38310 RepID=A0A2X4TXR2_9NOCA|nr:MCE family protein [Rhodococcus coprophilus]MBM7458255.1 phospholipid/cholesterol/gamma-HCH transport system substrate-binding protein [Rhodococcus coprophilus]SQI31771.1 Mce family protein [Rhodococcus coprophilus]
MRPNTIKFMIFALTMVLVFAGLAVVFSQARFTGSETYHAAFTDVSGLQSGDKVRIAGVQVGSVDGVDIGEGNHAEVEFGVDSKYTLYTGTRATVRYENLVGDRYLELLEGPGSVEVLQPGGAIPIEQTEPALDLDLLLGGFKPLLQGLDSQQVNDLSGALLQVFQGQGQTLVSLLGNTNSFTNSLADRDQLIGDVIDNLNAVLGTIDEHDQEFTDTIDRLSALAGGLAADRDPIGASIPQIAAGTADLTALLQNNRPDLQSVIAETNRSMTQLDLGEDDINRTLERLPTDYKKLIRVGAYGNFFQFFLCANTFKFSGPDGTTIRYTTANHDTGRCAKIE